MKEKKFEKFTVSKFPLGIAKRVHGDTKGNLYRNLCIYPLPEYEKYCHINNKVI